jgi:hypothetical protein
MPGIDRSYDVGPISAANAVNHLFMQPRLVWLESIRHNGLVVFTMSKRLVPWAARATFLGLGVLAIGVLLAAAATFGERLIEKTKPIAVVPPPVQAVDPIETGSIGGNDEIGRLIEQADAPAAPAAGKAAKPQKAQSLDELLKKGG